MGPCPSALCSGRLESMNLGVFHALTTGPIEKPIGDGSVRRWNLTVLDLGTLRVHSGVVNACDPF